MKLLIVTQKVDARDPIMGFFHRWLLEFAGRCESVVVLGLMTGEYDLPANIAVHSLGKERGKGKMRQILRFYRLLWKERKRYDAIFVHMTPVWVVLGWPVAAILRKPLYLWYEVRRGGRMLRAAVLLSRKTFSATKDGLPFRSPKNLVLGHGIDTEAFAPDGKERDPDLLCTVGRLTRIKRHDFLLRAFAGLPAPYRFIIAGGTITPADETYREEIMRFVEGKGLRHRVAIQFYLHAELPALYRRSVLFLHASGGGLDKALLEAMACGCPVLSLSQAASHSLPPRCHATEDTFEEKMQLLLKLSPEERADLSGELRSIVVSSHSLPVLVERLVEEMSV
jgi:glycosyltransferase involved in cell wall biosynthesis